MKFSFFPWAKKSTTSLLGIDIGSRAIKLVELGCVKGQYRLENYAVVPVPVPSMSGKSMVDHQAIADAIQSILQSKKIKTRAVVTGIANSAVMTKMIQLDRG